MACAGGRTTVSPLPTLRARGGDRPNPVFGRSEVLRSRGVTPCGGREPAGRRLKRERKGVEAPAAAGSRLDAMKLLFLQLLAVPAVLLRRDGTADLLREQGSMNGKVIDVSAWSASLQKSLIIKAKVKFNDMSTCFGNHIWVQVSKELPQPLSRRRSQGYGLYVPWFGA